MSVRRSLIWSYAAQASSFLISFGSSVVVARLISPHDFGVFGMAMAITTVMNVFLQFGIGTYIIREKSLTTETLRSLFTVNTMLTLVYFSLIQIGSFVSFRIHADEVGRFLQLFSIWPLVAMFESVPSALCTREMRFGLIASISVLRSVMMFVTTVALAYAGFAYMSFAWALILSTLATATAFNLACFRPEVWLPRFRDLKPLLHFGLDMAGVGGLNQISARLGEMTLGSILGLATLGLYTRASNLPATLYSNLYSVGANVIFSRLSQEFRETGFFHATYIRFMRILLAVLWPALFGMAVLANPLIHALYGPKWQGAAIPLACLVVATAMTVAIGMSAEVFVLRNQTRKQVKIEGFRACFGLALFAGGALVSVNWAAAAKLLEVGVAYLIYRPLMDNLVGGSSGSLERVYREAIILSMVAVAPDLLVMIYYRWSPTAPLLQIFLATMLGVALWCGTLLRTNNPMVNEVRSVAEMLANGFRRRLPAPRKF